MDSPQPNPPAHGQPAPPTITPPKHYTDGFGIASIISAALFLTIPGLILGIIGEFRAKSHRASAVLSRIGWIANLIMLLFSLVAGIIMFSIVMRSDEFRTAFEQQKEVSAKQKVFTADTFSVKAPDSFYDMSEDNPGATLSIGNDAKDLYLVAYSDSTGNIADGTTLDQYADQAYETFASDANFTGQKRERLAVGIIDNPQNLNVIDYKMQATYGINKFIYYDRYIKTNDGFYMLTTWTTPDRFDTNSPSMLSALASFKEASRTSQ